MSTEQPEYVVTEEEYVDAIATDWPYGIGGEASPELQALADEAVAAYPRSAKLWCMRGDLIQLGSEESKYELLDALESYHRAVAVDPGFAEAYQEIGYYHDVYTEDFPAAEQAFRKAVELGAGMHSYLGLARVLAELGEKDKAIDVLSAERCPFYDDLDVREMRDEVEKGAWRPSEEAPDPDTMNSKLQMQTIAAAQTVPLRAVVLRPGRPVESAIFVGDEDEQNRHFGIFDEGRLVGVASLFRHPLPEAFRNESDPVHGVEWQLRGMAVEQSLQKGGVGRALLNGCIEFVEQQPNTLLWCNARSEAVGFYAKNGFETRGDEFVIPDVGPHFVMVFTR